MTVLLDDDFNRGNENPLGSPYAKPSGVAALEINSFLLRNVTDATDSGAYHDITYDEDHWAELTASEATDGPNFGPCVRMSTTDDFYYLTSYNAANFFLFEVINLSYNQVDASVGTYTDTSVIYLEAQGDSSSTTVIGIVDTVTVINYTDTTSPITGGRPGILGYNGGWRASRFRAGDFASGGPFTLTPTSGVSVSGTITTTGDIALVDAITPTAAVAVSGTVAVTGEIGYEAEFGVDAPMNVSVAGTVATTGALALGLSLSGGVSASGAVSLAGTLALGLNLAASDVPVTGALAVTGDVAFEEPGDEPFSLTPSAAVALSGMLATTGETAYTVAVSLEPTAAVAVSGALSLAGEVDYEASISVAPSAAVAVAGVVALTGEVAFSDEPITTPPVGGGGGGTRRRRTLPIQQADDMPEVYLQLPEADDDEVIEIIHMLASSGVLWAH